MIQFLTPIASLAGKWMEGRQRKTELKGKLEEAKLQGQIKHAANDSAWEAKAMDASADSWKDEAWTLTFIALIFACFVPALQPYIDNFFRWIAVCLLLPASTAIHCRRI